MKRHKLFLSILLFSLFCFCLSSLEMSWKWCFSLFSGSLIMIVSLSKLKYLSVFSLGLLGTMLLILFDLPFLLPSFFILYFCVKFCIIFWDLWMEKQQKSPEHPAILLFVSTVGTAVVLFFSILIVTETIGSVFLTCLLLIFLFSVFSTMSHSAPWHKFLPHPPLLFTTFLPYFRIKLPLIQTKEVCKPSTSSMADAEILIHVADTRVGRLGHADFFFEGEIISFGNYDDSSSKLKGVLGDGMLFSVSNKEKYIDFCQRHRQKTIFSFGIQLTSAQKTEIRQQIAKIKCDASEWKLPSQRSLCPYASLLSQELDAKFYKLNQGHFKTYFILKNNCAHLCNTIFQSLHFCNSHQMITPGFLYFLLHQDLIKKRGVVMFEQKYPYQASQASQPESSKIIL